MAEGVVAEGVMACAGGATITGWALYLGCGPFWVGLLGALPFLAQLMQLPGAWLTSRFSVSFMRMLAAPLWGRLIDRLGARRVLRACVSGLVVSPLLWVLAGPERWWPIALEAVLGGVLLSGHGLALFALPLAVAPAKERPFYHAAFAMTGGAAFALASAFGGMLVRTFPPSHSLLGYSCTALQLTFLVSALARGFAALLSRQLIEPTALPLPARARASERPLQTLLAPSVSRSPPPPAS